MSVVSRRHLTTSVLTLYILLLYCDEKFLSTVRSCSLLNIREVFFSLNGEISNISVAAGSQRPEFNSVHKVKLVYIYLSK